jgi:ferric-dicitrate binding protein FerR (iron transport regulator)
MLHYDVLRQMTAEHRLHREAEAEVQRIALHARGRRARSLPLARELEHLRAARRRAVQRAGYVVVTVWPRR